MKKWLFLIALLFLILVAAFLKGRNSESSLTPAVRDNTQKSNTSASFNKNKYSTSESGSIWWIVNKNRPLPAGYAPGDLVVPKVSLRLSASSEEMKVSQSAAASLEQLITAAKSENLDIILVSGYRSYQLQETIYRQNVRQLGQAEADKVSAKPGTSEHQTGLVADLGPKSRKCELEVCFAKTPEGAWLAANAYKYGFIIRYPESKDTVTGYSFEPWHFRYVGTELANEMHKQGIATLEEFFGIE